MRYEFIHFIAAKPLYRPHSGLYRAKRIYPAAKPLYRPRSGIYRAERIYPVLRSPAISH